jgi:hypothetical protein
LKRAKVSYKQVETLVLYFEADALRIPAHQLGNHCNAGRCITPDYYTFLAAYEELVRHVEEVKKSRKMVSLISLLPPTTNTIALAKFY